MSGDLLKGKIMDWVFGWAFKRALFIRLTTVFEIFSVAIIAVSSAYNAVVWSFWAFKSEMYIEYNVGAREEPWGTTPNILNWVDKLGSQTH